MSHLTPPHRYPTRFQQKQDHTYYHNLDHLERLLEDATGKNGIERYKAYDEICTFLIDFPLWKTDDLFRSHLEKLLDRFLTKEIPYEIEKEHTYELVLYSLEHTMSRLHDMMKG